MLCLMLDLLDQEPGLDMGICCYPPVRHDTGNAERAGDNR